MGLIYSGIPKHLALWIKDSFKVESLVETGTYRGDTSIWASGLFNNVYTIEANKSIYLKTKNQLAIYKNIKCYFGNSSNVLKQVVGTVDDNKHKNTIYWLDAHWSLDETHGKDIECPLIDEIQAINTAHHNSYILIDDARLFLAPPNKPHDHTKWPTITQVIESLKKKNREIFIYNDVIIAIPKGGESEKFARHLQTYATKDMDMYIKSKSFSQTLINSISSLYKAMQWSVNRNKLIISLVNIFKTDGKNL